MRARKILILAAAALVGVAVVASTAAAAPVKPTDYQSRSHWLYLPSKSVKQKKVAVFYVYPTAYARAPGGPIYCAVDDPGMMQGAQVSFQRQATAFRTVGNVYAPYYRQIDATYQLSQPFAQQKRNIAGIPSTDVFAAFKHFLKHFDHGRPFILVGHSQGSAVLANLLAKYMKAHPAVYARMIAAYVPGYPIQRSYLRQHPFLKFARGAGDTGVIVSWNTEAPTIAAPSPVVQPGAMAINPITWTRKQTEASAAQEPRLHRAEPGHRRDAVPQRQRDDQAFHERRRRPRQQGQGRRRLQHHRRSAPPYFKPGGFPMGVLHTFDYPLYFFSVRANAADRVAQESHAGQEADDSDDTPADDRARDPIAARRRPKLPRVQELPTSSPSTRRAATASGATDRDSPPCGGSTSCRPATTAPRTLLPPSSCASSPSPTSTSPTCSLRPRRSSSATRAFSLRPIRAS